MARGNFTVKDPADYLETVGSAINAVLERMARLEKRMDLLERRLRRLTGEEDDE